MRILGVDPGLQKTGYGIIEVDERGTARGKFSFLGARIKIIEAGVVRTASGLTLSRRVEKIYGALKGLIEEYRPEVLVLEELYSHYKNPRTAILMAHARGVICLLAAQARIDLVGYAARKVKKAITGSGAATKDQMQRMVKDILGLKKVPRPHDVADALGLAIAHYNIKKKVF